MTIGLRTILVCLVLFLGLIPAAGQSLPDKIRGYKIYNAKPSIALPGSDPNHRADVTVSFDELKIISVGLTRAVVTVGATVTSNNQSSRINFLSFHDITVNGIPVEVEEYDHSTSFKKGVPITFESPLRASILFASAPRSILTELLRESGDWRINGTVFVFGKFKKHGFSFKRVIPVPIDLKVQDPLKALAR
ncbi:MAG: hypothetical protein ABIV21_08490 [Pyrinomonadaceae bacterium]